MRASIRYRRCVEQRSACSIVAESLPSLQCPVRRHALGSSDDFSSRVFRHVPSPPLAVRTRTRHVRESGPGAHTDDAQAAGSEANSAGGEASEGHVGSVSGVGQYSAASNSRSGRGSQGSSSRASNRFGLWANNAAAKRVWQ